MHGEAAKFRSYMSIRSISVNSHIVTKNALLTYAFAKGPFVPCQVANSAADWNYFPKVKEGDLKAVMNEVISLHSTKL